MCHPLTHQLSRGETIIVIEPGSSTIKLGYADSTTGPTHLLPSPSSALEDGKFKDPEVFQSTISRILQHTFPLRRPFHELALCLILPASLIPSRRDLEWLAKFVFEALEFPAFFVQYSPLMSLYACGVVNGLVVDLGYDGTSISPVLDSNVQVSASIRLPVGGKLFLEEARRLLPLDEAFCQSISAAGLAFDDDLLRAMLTGGAFDASAGKDGEPVAWILGGKDGAGSEKAQAPEQAEETAGDQVGAGQVGAAVDPSVSGLEQASVAATAATSSPTASPPPPPAPAGPTILISRMTLHALYETVFFPPDPSQVHLGRALIQAVRPLDADKHQMLLDHVCVTGGLSRLPGLKARLKAETMALLAASDYAAETQPRNVAFLKIPDYFPDMKGKDEHAAWFGASITAKIIFSDAKNFITRADYNEHGPKIAWEKPT